MKTFVYKCLIASFIFLIVFYLSFGVTKRQISREMSNLLSKENVEQIKKNLRKQITIAIEKDQFIKAEDAELINAFIKKIKEDLNNPNK
jgi:CHAT domain-containing protein